VHPVSDLAEFADGNARSLHETFNLASRDAQRHAVSYGAELRLEEGSATKAYTASTLNVSDGGCAVRVYGTLKPLAVGTLHIACGSIPIDVPVRVVWTAVDPRGHIAGLAFEALDGMQRHQIERLISTQGDGTRRASTSRS